MSFLKWAEDKVRIKIIFNSIHLTMTEGSYGVTMVTRRVKE
jgi:hypothetical protein